MLVVFALRVVLNLVFETTAACVSFCFGGHGVDQFEDESIVEASGSIDRLMLWRREETKRR